MSSWSTLEVAQYHIIKIVMTYFQGFQEILEILVISKVGQHLKFIFPSQTEQA